MYNTGIDLHRKTSFITTINHSGHLVKRANLANDEEKILYFFKQLGKSTKIVIESTANWYWLYDLLIDAGFDTVISDPIKTKAIASARIKNDKLDSHMLAQLLGADLVSTVPVSDLFGKKGLLYLKNASLPSYQSRQVDTHLTFYHSLHEQVSILTDEVRLLAKTNPTAKLLMTIPGVGPITQQYLWSLRQETYRDPIAIWRLMRGWYRVWTRAQISTRLAVSPSRDPPTYEQLLQRPPKGLLEPKAD